MNITQEQYNTVLQNIQNRYIKLELLNYQYQTVDELQGVAISGNITIDANSDVRRTGSIEIVVKDSSFEVGSGNKIWLDKYIRVYVGIESIRSGKIEYTNCGMFIIDAPSYAYNSSSNILSMSLLDLMCKMTGARNGYLKGVPVVLSAGENIRQAIIDTIALGGFTKYIVEESPGDGNIPVTLEFNQGSTIYDLLAGLRDIYPNYEIFFDAEGIFYYKAIPTGEGSAVSVSDALWQKIVVDEQINTDFQYVKNSVEVYGRTHDPIYTATSVTKAGTTIGQITLTPSVTSFTTDGVYSFNLKDGTEEFEQTMLRVGSSATYWPILDSNNNYIKIPVEEEETTFCVQFKGTYWLWLGHLQAYGFAEDLNAESPFYVDGTIGRIRLPLYGGEYDNCLTDDLAQQRAEYELWLHTNMNNSVSLSCVSVPWLDVNMLVEYTLQRNGKKAQYLIKSVSFGLAPTDSMSVNMIQFYPQSTAITSL